VEYFAQPRAACLARDAAAERADGIGPAGQVGEPVQVMLHRFVVHHARPVSVEVQRIARGVEGPQPGDRVEADQAVTLMRDNRAQRGGQFHAQFMQRQIRGRQRGHLPV
jgi:hypothetical protein